MQMTQFHILISKHARALSLDSSSLRNAQSTGDTSQMMSRGSANGRDQRLQTEAFQITHLDLFHNTPVTVGGRKKGKEKEGEEV